MAKKVKSLLAVVIALAMLLAVVGCGKEPVTLQLNKTTAELFAGESVRLTATPSRELDADEKIAWATSDASIATVANGTVRGVKEGTATITASIGDSSATCSVTVKTRRTMQISQAEATIDLSAEQKTVTLTATCSDGGEVTWSSSDESVATVSGGVVTGLKVGTAVITAKREEATASCTVRVVDPNAPVEYDIQRGTSNANVAKDPGVWYYFDKTSNGSQISVAVAKYSYSKEKGAAIEYSLAYCTEYANDADDGTKIYTENYLRYQPTWEIGTTYTFTCTLSANVKGFIMFGNRNNSSSDALKFEVEANGTVEVTYNGTVTDGMPLNMNMCFYGGSAAEPLETPIVITLSDIKFTATQA